MQENLREDSFFRSVCRLAIPAALQSMLQASFSVADQIIIGQLGSVEVAGVGLAGKFASILSVLAGAVGAAAGIMISQYLGQRNSREARRSFRVNLLLALGVAALFTGLCLLFPRRLMGLYSPDENTVSMAAEYLRIFSLTFLPSAGTTLLSTLLRCMERAYPPLFASLFAAVCNTGLNYILIFGRLGFAPMGVAGAAVASVISQVIGFLLILLLFGVHRGELGDGGDQPRKTPFHWAQYGAILLPILVCELMWSLGENIYAGIYGHLGTAACAAMTLLNPVQSLVIGALSGLSQAAGVLVGKRLGSGDYEDAYAASKKLLWYGLAGSLLLSAAVFLSRPYYALLYQVEPEVKALTRQIMTAYAIIAPFKVQNMILGGGIIRSGGKTGYVMAIDLIGTWVFGVPLGLLAAFAFRLTIPWVYFLLSLEECVRFAISLAVLRKRSWMGQLTAENSRE